MESTSTSPTPTTTARSTNGADRRRPQLRTGRTTSRSCWTCTRARTTTWRRCSSTTTKPLIPTTLGGVRGLLRAGGQPGHAVNKAKAGQTIPLKFKVDVGSPATTWEDYYRFKARATLASRRRTGRRDRSTRSSSRLAPSGGHDTAQRDGTGSSSTTSTHELGRQRRCRPEPQATRRSSAPTRSRRRRFTCDTDDELDTIEAYAPGASQPEVRR